MMGMDRSNGYMSRKARASVGDILFIMNRGNAQIDVLRTKITGHLSRKETGTFYFSLA
jgi:hypothetical protein